MTAALKRDWTEKARWCDLGIASLVVTDRRMDDLDAKTALGTEDQFGFARPFRLVGKKFR